MYEKIEVARMMVYSLSSYTKRLYGDLQGTIECCSDNGYNPKGSYNHVLK